MDKYVRPSLNRCDYIALPSKKFAKKFKKFIGLKKNKYFATCYSSRFKLLF